MKDKETPLTQRDVMRILYKHFKKDEAKCVKTYAKLERRCVVKRDKNDSGDTPMEYAKALFADGMAKDWLKDKPNRCKNMGVLLAKIAT